MRRFLVLATLLLATPTLAGEMLTLEGAVARGLEHNFEIRIAREEAEVSRIDRGLGRSALLPDLTLSGGYQLGWHDLESNSVTPGTLSESESEQLSGNLALSWTIFDGMEMFTTRRRFDRLAVRGELQLKGEIERQITAISLAYNNLVLQRQLLVAAEENLDVSEARLQQNRVRRDLGGVSETDLLLAEVARNTDRGTWLEQQLGTDRARRDLNLLLGGDPEDELIVSTEIAVEELGWSDDEISARVMSGNTALQLMEQGVILADYDAASARSVYWPRIALTSGYGYSDRTVSAPRAVLPVDMTSESRDLSVGLTLSYSLFDGFAKRTNLQKAKVGQKIAGLERESVVRDLTTQVAEALSTYRQRLTLVTLADNNEAAARRSLSLQRRLADSGAATSLEFRDAQLTLNRAISAHLQARYAAFATHTEIRRLAGLLLE